VADSAHATIPHLDAGAGMGIENAYILSNFVAVMGYMSDIDGAFRAYNSTKTPRTQECIKKNSRGYGFLTEAAGYDGAKSEVTLKIASKCSVA
jgi:salicylate hydroxylase